MIVKLDLGKAYDYTNWDLLEVWWLRMISVVNEEH